MKILITGAGGFIGRYLAGSFLDDGHDIMAAYRNSRPELSGISSRIKFVKVDLEGEVRGIEPPDVIIHAAAHTHLIPNSTAFDYIRSNVMGMLNLCNFAISAKPKIFINLSTISVYGDVTVAKLDENTPLNKPEMYGLTKYLGEMILMEHAHHFSSVSIRLPGVVGKGYFTPWIGKVLKATLNDDSIVIYNADSIFNNIADLIELKRFMSCAIDSGFAGSASVNLAASEPLKIREVIDLIIGLTGSKSQVIERQTKRRSFSIDTGKINRLFNFEPSATREIVARYAEGNLLIKNPIDDAVHSEAFELRSRQRLLK